jgi:pantoate kinase
LEPGAAAVTVRPSASAFAPCHVSAFFVPHIVPKEPERTGSQGGGICLDVGVAASVRVEAAPEPAVRVERRGQTGPARVTEAALRQLLRDAKLTVTCTVDEGAPVGQGFGISAASALASTFALARCLGLARSDALRAAHVAEVRLRTGLGDAVAAFLGGAVVRLAPGLPPYGRQERLAAAGEVVVATVGPPIETASVLRDAARLARVAEVGKTCLAALSAKPTLDTLFAQGARFAHETQIVAPETLDAIDACSEGGAAMAAMLGNTVVAYGNTDALVDVLRTWGEPRVVGIDEQGLRLVPETTAST